MMVTLVLTRLKATEPQRASLPCEVICGSTGWAGWKEGWIDGVAMGCPAPWRALNSWNRHRHFGYYVWILNWRLRLTVHPKPAYNTGFLGKEEEGTASRKAKSSGYGLWGQSILLCNRVRSLLPPYKSYQIIKHNFLTHSKLLMFCSLKLLKWLLSRMYHLPNQQLPKSDLVCSHRRGVSCKETQGIIQPLLLCQIISTDLKVLNENQTSSILCTSLSLFWDNIVLQCFPPPFFLFIKNQSNVGPSCNSKQSYLTDIFLMYGRKRKTWGTTYSHCDLLCITVQGLKSL